MEASGPERDKGKENEKKGKRLLKEEEEEEEDQEKEKLENKGKKMGILTEEEEIKKTVLEIMQMCENEFRKILGKDYDKEVLMAITTYVIDRKKRGNSPLLPLSMQLQLEQILHQLEQEPQQEQRERITLDLNASPPQDDNC